jgi:hypothetical protein
MKLASRVAASAAVVGCELACGAGCCATIALDAIMKNIAAVLTNNMRFGAGHFSICIQTFLH